MNFKNIDPLNALIYTTIAGILVVLSSSHFIRNRDKAPKTANLSHFAALETCLNEKGKQFGKFKVHALDNGAPYFIETIVKQSSEKLSPDAEKARISLIKQCMDRAPREQSPK